MKRKTVKILALIMAFASLLTTTAFADSLGGGTVTATALNMRSGASTNDGVLAVLPNGAKVIVEAKVGDWYKVTLNGVTGYVHGDYLTVTPNAEVSGGTASVTGDYVYMRSGPSTNDNIYLILAQGTEVTVTGVSDKWFKIKTSNGVEGYMHSDYLKLAGNETSTPAQTTTPTTPSAAETPAPAPTETPMNEPGTVAGDFVRLRSGPSTSHDIFTTLNRGIPVTILGSVDGWYKVKTAAGHEGYMSATYIAKGAAPTPNASNVDVSTIGAQVVATAKQYLGYPYVWGGMSPSGFDCSGFVNYVYLQHGYKMNRVAQTIFNNDGAWVARENLQVGDLLFFGSSIYNVGHVGMYIGNGQFIHAASSSTGVIISELEGWYSSSYVGAKRIIG